MERVLYVCGGIVALGAAGAVVAKVVRVVLTLMREVREFLADWRGEPSRPGVPPRRGVMERLERIEAQVNPNGGNSMHDKVNQIKESVGGTT